MHYAGRESRTNEDPVMKLKGPEILRLTAIAKWADDRRVRAMRRGDIPVALRACDLLMRAESRANAVVLSSVSTYSDAA
jgi:hypothetical protein